MEHFRRLGLLQIKRFAEEEDIGHPLEVKRLVYRFGRIEGNLAGRYYSSHRQFGGRKIFWLVGFCTLHPQLEFVDDFESPMCSDVEAREELRTTEKLIELKQSLHRRAEYLPRFDGHFTARLDKSIPLGGPRASQS